MFRISYLALIMMGVALCLPLSEGRSDSRNSTAKKKEKADIGTRDFSNESLFTGDVAFSIAISDAKGVTAALRYNSNAHKAVIADNKVSQSGWIGLGWSLNLGSIQGDINNTRDPGDDKYFFVGPDFSSELIHDTGNSFMLREYRYWKITREVSNSNIVGWTIVHEDGTIQRYGNYDRTSSSYVLDYGVTNATRCMIGWGNYVELNNFAPDAAPPSLLPYQWDLSDIQDVNGNHTTIHYQQVQGAISGTTLLYTKESYPLDITDRAGRKIEFTLYSTPLLGIEPSIVGYGQSKGETRSLRYVLLKDSLGTLISGREFSYDSMNVLYRTSSNNKKLYLKKISELDASMTEVRRTDFEYAGVTAPLDTGDHNPGALKKITLPEGGTIEYTYDKAVVITDRSPTVQLGGTYFGSFGAGRIGSNPEAWSLSGSDFFVVRRGNYLEAYRWGATNRFYLDGTFPLGSESDPTGIHYWVHNDYVVVLANSKLWVVKRKGDGWMSQLIESSVSVPQFAMVGLESDYFVYAWGCSGSELWPQVGNVRVCKFTENWTWVTQPLGQAWVGTGASFISGSRFFTTPIAGTPQMPVWMWNPTSQLWENSHAPDFFGGGGREYLVTWNVNNGVFVQRWDDSTWRVTEVAWPHFGMQTPNGANIYPGENFFVFQFRDAASEPYIATASASGWVGTRLLELLPEATIDNRARITVGPDFVAVTWYRSAESAWKVGIIKFRNGQWQQGVIIDTLPQILGTQWEQCNPSASGSTLFVEQYEPTLALKLKTYSERNYTWSKQEFHSLNLGWWGGYQNSVKPCMQPGLNFSVCVIDSNLQRYGDGTVLAWKKSYTSDLREAFSDTTPGGYDFRVSKKRVTDGRGGVTETHFTYSNGSYDDDITTARYNKAISTPAGSNGRTVTYFYNDMGPGQAEDFVNVPYFTYLDGSPYKISIEGSAPGSVPSRVDNTWSVTHLGTDVLSQILNPCETTQAGQWATVPGGQLIHTVIDDGAGLDPNDYAYSDVLGDMFYVRIAAPPGPLDPTQYSTVTIDARTHTPGQTAIFDIVLWERRNGIDYWLGEQNGCQVNSSSSFQSFSFSIPNIIVVGPSNLYVSVENLVRLIEVGRIKIDAAYSVPKGPYLVQLAQDTKTKDGVALQQVFEYCSSNGLQYRLSETNSDGSQRITETRYAHQRSSYADMGTTKHMLSQPYYTRVSKGSDVEAMKWTLWGNADGVWRPREEWVWKGDGSVNDLTAPEDPDGSSEAFKVTSYDSYDLHGNLLQASDANGVPSATKLGYSGLLPIGTLKNATTSNSFVAVFDDANASNWSGSGTWSIVNGAYQQSAGTITTPWFTPRVYGGLTLADGVVEGDIRFDNAGDYRYAAIGKSVDATHEILFELRKTDTAAWIEVIVNGVAVATATASYSYSENTWYHVRGELIGTQAKMYVNGVLMCTLNNSNVNIGLGKVGLATYRTVASFDNVRFHLPNVLATVQTYDPVTLKLTTLSDENGDLTRLSYDGIGRKIKAFAGTSGSASIIAENRFHYSRSLDGAFSTLHPNSVETDLYPDAAGFSDFLSSSGWTYSGDITFNVLMGGERTVRMGTLSGGWDYICKQAPSGHSLARVDFYPDNSTGGAPHVIAFDGSNYRFCVQYDAVFNLFRIQLCMNGVYSYPLYFQLPAPRNQWYTVEIEKTETGEGYAFVYPKGQGRIYQTGYMFTSGGYPANWSPVVISWANDDYFYLANHYVGLFDRDVTYFDGYGRPIQAQQQNKAGSLVLSNTTYDSLGRVSRSFKPYEKDFLGTNRHKYDSTFAATSDAYYNAMDVAESHTDGYPFNETRYFTDPLGRPQQQSSPGPVWRIGSGREVKSEYSANSGSEVPGYGIQTLNKQRILDEDNTVTDAFADKFGQTVASTVDPTGLNLRTLFKYDITGNLNQSITPRGDTTRYSYNPAGKLAQKSSPDQGTTQYLYDMTGNVRLVKDAPHTGTTANSVNITPPGGYIACPNSASGQFTIGMPGRVTISASVYDIDTDDYVTVRIKANGVIVCTTSSTGWSGSSNAIVLPKGTYTYEVQTYGYYGYFGYSVVCNSGYEFVYYKYDQFNRLLEMGEYESSSTSANFTPANAENTAFPTGTRLVASAFTFDTPASEPLASGQRNLKGRVSSAISYRQGVPELFSYYSYDEFGNTEWVLQKNSAGKWWQLKEDHDLQGRVTRKQYLDGTSSANNLYTQFTYDQAGRLTKVTTGPTLARIDSVQEALYTYYAGGTVKRLQLATSQGVDYRYNTRDWVKQINEQNLTTSQDPGHDGSGGTGVPYNDRFGAILYYNQESFWGLPSSQGATPHWNGNIASLVYNMSGVYTDGTSLVGNLYTYDKANRLTGSNFFDYLSSWSSTPKFDDSSYTYDANGNILTLKRYGSNGNPMDNLSYVYATGKNRLRHVNDTVSPTAFSVDIDQQVTDNYAYDDNGSLQKDEQRDIGFIVNDIRNLPLSVWKKSTGQEIRYYYDTEGRRIRKDGLVSEYYVNSPEGNTEAVVKSDITQATHNIWALDNIGQAKRSGSSWSRYYYLKDHLGTVKLTVDGTGTVVGWDDFYPFGMVMDGRSGASGSDPRYKYTGKERDTESGLDYFGARLYDSRLARWLSVDPLNTGNLSQSGYSYSLNSPLVYLDPDGMLEKRASDYVINHLLGKRYTKFGEEYVPNSYPAWRILNEDQTACNGLVGRAYKYGAGYPNFPIEMPDQIKWFKKQGWWKEKKGEGEVGDVMFLGNTDTPGERHELIITDMQDDPKNGRMYTIVQAGSSGSKEYKERFYTVREIEDTFSGGRRFVGFGSVSQTASDLSWFHAWVDRMLGLGPSPAQMWEEMHRSR